MKAPADIHRAPQTGVRAPLSTRRDLWWWIAAAVLAIVIFSVSVPVLSTVYYVPVLAAFAVGLLQCGSIVLSIIAPRWAIASWVSGVTLFFMFGTATPGAPWPLDVCGLLSLCALLVLLGLRRPVIEGVIAWGLSVAASLLVSIYVGLQTPEAVTVGGAVTNLVTTTVITASVLLVSILVAQRGQIQGELETEQQRRGLVEERNRIARELHDVVAHSMSVIQVQASSAPYRLPQLDEAARGEFRDIAASARSAIQEMRQLLGVLRSEDANVENMPQPGIAQIADLVPALARAGITVTVDIAPTLPTEGLVSAAAYRIAQESLSNVVRHAPGATARVLGELVDGAVVLYVENDAPTVSAVSAPVKGGHGLIGMRERCAMLGGTLFAGPTADGGFRVMATLPTAGSAGPVTPAPASSVQPASSTQPTPPTQPAAPGTPNTKDPAQP
jgi:signal transduction histidine kinase